MGCCATTEEGQPKLSKQKSLPNEGGLHTQLLKENKSASVWEKYKKGKLLGAGMTGAVHVGIHRDTGVRYAIKSINKRKLDPAQLGELKNEVALLRILDHPSIVRLYEVYELPNRMYLVMQLLEGKDLGQVRFNTERQVAKVMRKIVHAIGYCHSKGVVHRDIKLENFVFTSVDNLEDVIVIDFGIGKKTVAGDLKVEITESKATQKRNMKTVCGTPYYMSPQVLDGRYDQKCDCWAIGVLAFILLTSRPPFNGRYKRELDNRIRAGVVQYPNSMSVNARNFISNLLKVDARQRWTCQQALQSDWMKNVQLADVKSFEIEKDTLEKMIQFQQAGRLKKMALMIRAFTDTSKRVQKLKATFDSLDTTGTGTLTHPELKEALVRHKINLDSKTVFDALDVDKRGEISYTEFLAATMGDELQSDREILKGLFDSLDITKNGRITKKDLLKFLGSDAKKYDVEQLLGEGDETGNLEITFEEFVKMMERGPGEVFFYVGMYVCV
ncbi:hypothetical protein AAMO2058_000043900 [Amorphochlora amoebiformis]